MFPKNWLLIPFTLAMATFLPGVNAATLQADYLAGNWEINSKEACGGKNAEHLILRRNGSLEYGRRGKAEAVGFWRIEDDVVVLEMMSRPATFRDIHAELESYEDYDLYRMQIMPVEQVQDRISAVGSMDGLIERLDMRRCP